MGKAGGFQEHRSVKFPEILNRGLIFRKFTSWWLCRSFCTYSWRKLQISCPNLLPCRTALVKKTEALAPSAAQTHRDGDRPKLPYGADVFLTGSWLSGRQNPLRSTFQACLACACGERGVGEGDSLFRKALVAVSHPLFHISSDTGFHGDCRWHWEGRSWAEQFPG